MNHSWFIIFQNNSGRKGMIGKSKAVTLFFIKLLL